MNEQALDARIALILEKVALINKRAGSERDPQRAVARARALYAPLSESVVRAFESAEAIQLPADYRAYLLKAGNGGGPIGILGGSYPDWQVALWPLERWYAAAYCEPPGAGFLSAPSPLGLPRPGGHDWRHPDRGPGDSYWFRGAIALADEGDGWYSLLIVSGPSRGCIASSDGGYSEPFVTTASFLDWYERKLDRALR